MPNMTTKELVPLICGTCSVCDLESQPTREQVLVTIKDFNLRLNDLTQLGCYSSDIYYRTLCEMPTIDGTYPCTLRLSIEWPPTGDFYGGSCYYVARLPYPVTLRAYASYEDYVNNVNPTGDLVYPLLVVQFDTPRVGLSAYNRVFMARDVTGEMGDVSNVYHDDGGNMYLLNAGFTGHPWDTALDATGNSYQTTGSPFCDIAPQRGGTARVQAMDDCGWCIGPRRFYFPKAGGTGEVSIKAMDSTTCTWSVTKVAPCDWLTITGGGTGTGAGTLTFSVTENTSFEPRGCGLLLNNMWLIVVLQSGCSAVLSPYTYEADKLGETKAIAVTADAGCNWTITRTGHPFELSATSGTGSAEVLVTMPPNYTGSDRTCYLAIGSSKCTVTQKYCTCGEIETSYYGPLESTGGSFTFTLTSDCPWEATCTEEWVTLEREGDTVTVTVTANPGYAREATVVTPCGNVGVWQWGDMGWE